MEKGILFFKTPSCVGCQQLEPIVASLIREGIKVKKINCEYDASTPKRYNVQSVPTLIVTDMRGNEVKRMTGGQGVYNPQQLKEWMNK